MLQWFDDNTQTLADVKPSRRHALKAMGGFRFLLVVLVSVLTLAPQIGHPSPVAAATLSSYAFAVNTTADTHDKNPGDGKCADKKGLCSLRAATEEASALPSGSSITITVPAGTYTLQPKQGFNTLGLMFNTITITGAGSKTTIIKGNQTFNIVYIAPNMTAYLNQLTIEGGYSADYGGGINNTGTLTVSNSTLSANGSIDGGGIKNGYGATLTVSSSIFSNNTASYNGGGIDNYGGTMTVTSSTFSGNKAGQSGLGGGIDNETYGTLSVSNSTFSGNTAGGGGGIENDQYGTLSVSNSTFSGNTAGGGGGIATWGYHGNTGISVSNSTFSNNTATDGGAIEEVSAGVSVSNSTFSGNKATGDGGAIVMPNSNGGSVSVNNSTFSANSATGKGGAIANDDINSSVTLTGTIVANSTGGSNCSGTITDGGYNLDSGTSCGFRLKSDLTKTNPKLGPLRHNGGPTWTMALLKGSKAIDWVAASSCPATDQRGHKRPDNSESACDIGAYESSY